MKNSQFVTLKQPLLREDCTRMRLNDQMPCHYQQTQPRRKRLVLWCSPIGEEGKNIYVYLISRRWMSHSSLVLLLTFARPSYQRQRFEKGRVSKTWGANGRYVEQLQTHWPFRHFTEMKGDSKTKPNVKYSVNMCMVACMICSLWKPSVPRAKKMTIFSSCRSNYRWYWIDSPKLVLTLLNSFECSTFKMDPIATATYRMIKLKSSFFMFYCYSFWSSSHLLWQFSKGSTG